MYFVYSSKFIKLQLKQYIVFFFEKSFSLANIKNDKLEKFILANLLNRNQNNILFFFLKKSLSSASIKNNKFEKSIKYIIANCIFI